ncbi:MAG: hypothetical protein ABIJ56_06360 [Pseudomonadota bacterium]
MQGNSTIQKKIAQCCFFILLPACYVSSAMEYSAQRDGGVDALEDPEADPVAEPDEPEDAFHEDVQDEDEAPPQWCAGDMYCAVDHYCELFSCGVPGGTFGICLPVPDGCFTDCTDLVCGCDGMTWCSDCERRAERVSLAYVGGCIEDIPCEGPTGSECPDELFCDTSLPASSGCVIGAEGVCRPIPEWCPDDINLTVCGCDGATYGNDCFRMMEAVSRHESGNCG